MNPFMEPTVARPLPEHQRELYWPDGTDQVVGSMPTARPSPDQPKSADVDGARAPDPQRTSRFVTIQRLCGQRSVSTFVQAAIRRCRIASSWLSAVTLAVGLGASGVASVSAYPIVFSGIVAVAGILMPTMAYALDVNQASALELQAVRGIGPKTAQTIVAERTRGGPFSSLTDLSERVKGIGAKKAAALQAGGLVATPGAPGKPAAQSKSAR